MDSKAVLFPQINKDESFFVAILQWPLNETEIVRAVFGIAYLIRFFESLKLPVGDPERTPRLPPPLERLFSVSESRILGITLCSFKKKKISKSDRLN